MLQTPADLSRPAVPVLPGTMTVTFSSACNVLSAVEPAPKALEWLVYLRDNGADMGVTQGERALASLLVTYGKGQNIFVSMKTLARITGWSRTTVIRHRDGLMRKGLVQDITGNPDEQKRTYRLTRPAVQGVQNLDTPAQILNTRVQILDTPCTDSGHNIKLLDQEVDQAAHQHHGPDDDEQQLSPTEDRGGQAPHTPQDDAPWEFTQDDRERWAGLLGIRLSSIRESFWIAFGDAHNAIWAKAYAGCECQCDSACPHDEDYFRENKYCPCICPVSGNNTECECKCVHDGYWATAGNAAVAAARDAAEKRNPPGYFQTVVMQLVDLALYRAQQQAQAARATRESAEAIAAEIASLSDRIITETGLTPKNLEWWVGDWRRKERLNDEQVRDRLRRNLEKRLAKMTGEAIPESVARER